MTSVAELRRQAENAMREDAPPAAALARERLLQMYRERHATSHRLDIESEAGDRWEPRDLDCLAWLCRLGAAGHCGAARLIERALSAGVWVRGDNPAMRELGLKYPRIARYIAVWLSHRPPFELDEMRAWLERAGGVHARIAAAMREAFQGPAQHGKEFDMVTHHITRAEHALTRGTVAPSWPEDLMAEIASSRLLRSPATQRPAAQELLERAAALGSRSARDELWQQRHSAAPDKTAFLRECLAAIPSPGAGGVVGRTEGRMIGAALEHGETGAPPDPAAALPWYAAALGFKLPDAEAFYKVGLGFEGRRDKTAAHTWYERGIGHGEEACLRRWLDDARINQRLGIMRDGAAALAQVRRGIANGIVAGTPALLAVARRFVDLPGAEWQEVIELLGYTRELRAKEKAAADEAGRQRAGFDLQAALDFLPHHPERASELLQQVLRHGNTEQRARAREALDGKGWPPLPPEDVAMYWKLVEKIESQSDDEIYKPALCDKYLSMLGRDPTARGDARFARLQSAIARVRGLMEKLR